LEAQRYEKKYAKRNKKSLTESGRVEKIAKQD